MRRSRLYPLTVLFMLPLASACLPSGGGGGGGTIIIDDGDGGTSNDAGSNNVSNNTTPTTKTCSDGVVVPIAQPCNCPQSAADCDDGDPCTTEVFTSGPDCGTCSASVINTCGGIDGCCPQICTVDNDSDCGGCGNGRVETGETCDGECPTDIFQCPEPAQACQRAVLNGEADLCTAECGIEEVSECIDEDGCCPEGCNADNDYDCEGGGFSEHGDACASDPEGCEGTCITRDIIEDIPLDGICSQFPCSPGQCNNGTECAIFDESGDFSLCLRPCDDDSDCFRDDLSCVDVDNGSSYCI